MTVDVTSAPPPTPPGSEILSDEQRSRILSTTRLTVILSIFVLALLVLMGAVAFYQVSRIFDQLTPAVARDLEWKSARGAAELSHTMEVPVALAEASALAATSKTYIEDKDVSAVLVVDAEQKVLFSYPSRVSARVGELLFGPAGQVRETAASYATWLPVEIEGAEIGRVALEVSKNRLQAGAELRQNILKGSAVGSLVALVLALFFVSFYIGPLIRVTEKAFQDLEVRTKEAMESARLKSEFLANMSHEIRTPMNGVIGMAELLQKTDLTKKQRRYARTIATSASALLTIINDILDFSKIDAGKLSVRPVETDVKRLAEEVAQLHAPQGQAKGIEVLVSVATDLPRGVMVDHDRLRQVLNNIMGNAVKFTNTGSVMLRVWVQQHHREDDAASLGFSVTDTGIGIAHQDQERVFEHFSQADGSLTRAAGGTGLGLTISKHLVELMGGTLELQSEPGKGSCFSFSLDCPVLTGEGSRPTGKLPRTLIIDDNETNRTVLEELLQAWGVPNDSARSGSEALDMLSAAEARGEQFELALVDQVMDPMDGLVLARTIRARSGHLAPRLVLLSSLSESQSLDGVFDDGLTKPVLQEDLRRVVQGVDAGTRPEEEGRVTQTRFVGNPRVLVAEDNAINREVMREILDELEISADLVENGKQVLAALEEKDYPIILMDCQMPVMDGYEATRRIRRLPNEKSHVPIVAVTAHAVHGEREKALEAGMTDYITKPVTIVRLVRMLAKYLETTEVDEQPDATGAPRNVRHSSYDLAEPEEEERSSQRRKELATALDPGVSRSATVIKLFRKMVPDQMAGLFEAVATGNSAEVKQVAHKLKGSCLALGATRMAGTLKEIEPNPDNVAVLLVRLNEEFTVVLSALEVEAPSKSA